MKMTASPTERKPSGRGHEELLRARSGRVGRSARRTPCVPSRNRHGRRRMPRLGHLPRQPPRMGLPRLGNLAHGFSPWDHTTVLAETKSESDTCHSFQHGRRRISPVIGRRLLGGRKSPMELLIEKIKLVTALATRAALPKRSHPDLGRRREGGWPPGCNLGPSWDDSRRCPKPNAGSAVNLSIPKLAVLASRIRSDVGSAAVQLSRPLGPYAIAPTTRLAVGSHRASQAVSRCSA